MSIADVNLELMATGYCYKEFEKAACANSASDRDECMVLQDHLTTLRNQLNILNYELEKQIKELSK
jgi:hypothetical protein